MANRYWVGGNADWDATAGTKWATSSGGTGGETVPTSSDAVFLDNGTGTGNVTIGSGYTATCASLNCTGYLNTLAVGTRTIDVAGNVTLGSGMTITGSSTALLRITGTATLTANGKTWPGKLTLIGTYTYTLADNWKLSYAFQTATGDVTVNGYNIECVGTLLNANNTQGTTPGSATTLTITGGTWALQGWCGLSTELKGDITLGTGTSFPCLMGCTLTYTSGNITCGTEEIRCSNIGTTGMTLNTNGTTFYALDFRGTATHTIGQGVAATFIILGDTNLTFGGSYGWTCGTLALLGNTTNRDVTLKVGNTYTVTTELELICTTTTRTRFKSSIASTSVPLVFSGSTQNLQYVDATDIDSSGGNPIYSNGTLLRTTNWYPPSVAPAVNLIYRAEQTT